MESQVARAGCLEMMTNSTWNNQHFVFIIFLPFLLSWPRKNRRWRHSLLTGNGCHISAAPMRTIRMPVSTRFSLSQMWFTTHGLEMLPVSSYRFVFPLFQNIWFIFTQTKWINRACWLTCWRADCSLFFKGKPCNDYDQPLVSTLSPEPHRDGTITQSLTKAFWCHLPSHHLQNQ